MAHTLAAPLEKGTLTSAVQPHIPWTARKSTVEADGRRN